MNASENWADRLENADPINDELLAAHWSATDAHAAILEEITSVPTNTLTQPQSAPETATRVDTAATRKRWRPVQLAVAAAVALAVAMTATFAMRSDPAYAISENADGSIQVNVLPSFRDGDALARDLRDRGIDADVTTVPASPSMVGTVELFSADSDYAGITFGGDDGSPNVFDWTIDPSVFDGTLLVTVYVEADDGEPFEAAQEIFEPGEKLGGLHCALGKPMRAADVNAYLAQVGLSPVWSVVTPTSDPSITNSTVVESVPEGIILSGYAVDNATASFDVLPDNTTFPQPPTSKISDSPCTPEAAAAWK